MGKALYVRALGTALSHKAHSLVIPDLVIPGKVPRESLCLVVCSKGPLYLARQYVFFATTIFSLALRTNGF